MHHALGSAEGERTRSLQDRPALNFVLDLSLEEKTTNGDVESTDHQDMRPQPYTTWRKYAVGVDLARPGQGLPCSRALDAGIAESSAGPRAAEGCKRRAKSQEPRIAKDSKLK